MSRTTRQPRKPASMKVGGLGDAWFYIAPAGIEIHVSQPGAPHVTLVLSWRQIKQAQVALEEELQSRLKECGCGGDGLVRCYAAGGQSYLEDCDGCRDIRSALGGEK